MPPMMHILCIVDYISDHTVDCCAVSVCFVPSRYVFVSCIMCAANVHWSLYGPNFYAVHRYAVTKIPPHQIVECI